jgi:hypothetical protein
MSLTEMFDTIILKIFIFLLRFWNCNTQIARALHFKNYRIHE